MTVLFNKIVRDFAHVIVLLTVLFCCIAHQKVNYAD